MSVTYNPGIVRDGLVAYLDADNPKSFSPNTFIYPTDIYGWINTSAGVRCTLSRDTITSPVGSTPMKMEATGDDPYTPTYNTASWNISTVANSQTWVLSVWVKASEPVTCELFVFGADSSGTAYVGGAWIGIVSVAISVTTSWQRFQCPITFNNASVAYIQTRLDGPTGVGVAGKIVWWDGLQVELASTASTFNAKRNANRSTWWDLTGNGNDVTINNYPAWNGYYFDLNGTNQWMNDATPNLPTGISGSTQLVWCWPDSTSTADNYVGLTAYGGRTSSNSRLLSLYVSGTTMYVSMAYWGNDWVPNNVAVTANSWNMCGLSATGASYTNNTTLINGNGSGIVTATGSSSSYATTMATTSVNLTVGCTDYPGRYLKGRIATVMYYNRQLSPNELQQNFAAMKGRFGL